jgi:hypothetical protein
VKVRGGFFLAESWLAESLKHGEEVMGGGGEKAETLKWHSTLGGRLSTLHFGKIIGKKTTDHPDLHG